jgi:hypothetical protein
MLTAWCLAVAFAAPWLAGAPLVWLGRRGRALRPSDWLWAPFVGLTALVCPLQALVVFADLPLRDSAPRLGAAVALLWAAMLATRAGRDSLRRVPVRVLALALAAYLAQGSELLQRGVADYRGNLISDQFNYVVLAQFLSDYPYSTGRAEQPGRPWLELVMGLKQDRLGQSVLHGALALGAGRDCLDLFFPTLFLGSALLVPAVRLLAPRFGIFGRRAEAVALVAALVPGVTTILADCYLSHALFIPLLMAYLAALLRAARRPRHLPVAGVLFAAAFVVYTEFTPLLVGVGGAAALAAVAAGRAGLLRSALLVAAPATFGVLLAAGGWKGALEVAARSRGMGTQIDLPLSGAQILERVWLDVVRVQAPSTRVAALGAGAFAAACFSLAAAGWLRFAWRAVRVGQRWAPLAAAAALVGLPATVAVAAPPAKYALFKLLMTVSPLFVLGLGLFAAARPSVGRAARTGRIAATALALLLVADTVAHQSAIRRRDLKEVGARWHDPELREVTAALRSDPGAEVVVALGEAPDAWVPSGAILYFARQQPIRIDSPRRVWLEPLDKFEALNRPAGEEPRPGAIVVTRPGRAWDGRGEVLLRTEHFLVLRAGAPAGHARAGR